MTIYHYDDLVELARITQTDNRINSLHTRSLYCLHYTQAHVQTTCATCGNVVYHLPVFATRTKIEFEKETVCNRCLAVQNDYDRIYDYDEYDEDDEDQYEWEIAVENCPKEPGGYCPSAGTEYCDLVCPFSDREWIGDDESYPDEGE